MSVSVSVRGFLAADEQAAVQLSPHVFGAAGNDGLVQQVVVAYQAAGRAGTQQQKNRAAVSGGGRKPWRQKGSGRARSGSSSSPIWRGGGVTFAAQPRSYAKKVNRKMYRAALRVIFSELLRSERLTIIDQLTVPETKTKQLYSQLSALGLSDVLLITDDIDEAVYLAARNLKQVGLVDVVSIDPVSLLVFEQVAITRKALQQIEEWLA